MRPQAAQAFLQDHPECILEEVHYPDLLGPGEWWGAIFSGDDLSQWRYLLWRMWDETKPFYVALMLNPSTADHLADDPTVQGIVKRARTKGYGGVIVVNVFAWRDKSPAKMKKAKDPVGPANDKAILLAITTPDCFLLCAWGPNAKHLNRNEEIRCLIKQSGTTPYALRISQEGEPEHPLYKPFQLEPSPWDASGASIS